MTTPALRATSLEMKHAEFFVLAERKSVMAGFGPLGEEYGCIKPPESLGFSLDTDIETVAEVRELFMTLRPAAMEWSSVRNQGQHPSIVLDAFACCVNALLAGSIVIETLHERKVYPIAKTVQVSTVGELESFGGALVFNPKVSMSDRVSPIDLKLPESSSTKISLEVPAIKVRNQFPVAVQGVMTVPMHCASSNQEKVAAAFGNSAFGIG